MIEAMVAAAVLAIGIVGIVGLQSALFSSAKNSHAMSTASYLLQYRSEELGQYNVQQLIDTNLCAGVTNGCRLAGGGEAPDAPCTVRVFDPQPIDRPQPAEPGPFRVDVGIVPHTGINHPNSRVATISVCWIDRGVLKQLQSRRVLGDR